ncbi:GEMINIVIRUS REP INTERACTING KINASE 1 ISOFORM 1 [Salix viminalis]|uniref:GEMINIVIRUS REP INTERACTING KINASE 1 ISOFORM 1 n=1 Tax=Salix viminalis TaxID=40686 RepID=A0A9Q0TM80_SALVM|nr:GEMINIVIRUS REP INTERACTING KINASE 1 ISOFORM 1 [Salix viminalis]
MVRDISKLIAFAQLPVNTKAEVLWSAAPFAFLDVSVLKRGQFFVDPKFLLQKMNPEAGSLLKFAENYSESEEVCFTYGLLHIQSLLSRGNILVDKEEQSIPCTPRKAQACKKKTPVTVITSVKHSKVSILKTLEHPNIINLAEVIDDQKSDYMYMVLEYVESSCTSNVSETKGQIDETTARKYSKDVFAGLIYLHHHVKNSTESYLQISTLTSNCELQWSFCFIAEILSDVCSTATTLDDNDGLLRFSGTPAFTVSINFVHNWLRPTPIVDA